MKTKRGALKAIENSYQLPGGLVVSSCLLICEVVINEFSSLRSFKGFKPLEQSMGISVLIVSRIVIRKHSPSATFPANFSGDIFFRHRPHQEERLEEISNFSQSTGARKQSTRRPRALLQPATESHAPAREAFSGDAPPPPASPDADQPPYIPGSPIRALHVPLLGIFVSVGPPNSLSGEAPATFSPPQSLHVPWEVFFYLSGGQGEPLGDPGRYRRLVGKLNYLTITRPDISFPVSVVSQFLQSPCDSHWDAVIHILRYIKSTPGQGVLYENRGHTQVVVLPSSKSTVGCRWVYAVKVGPDGQVDRLKAYLVAKGYTQVYGSDYGDTFPPVAKTASVCLLLSMVVVCSWPLYQLDIKNVFLHGDLAEEVYMEQPPGFVAQGESGLVCRLRRSLYGLKQSPRAWFGRFSSVVQEFGILRSTTDHSIFYHHNSLGQCIYLVVYVDDIVIIGSDQDGIQKLKQHLFTHFQTKDLGKLKYFLGIEIAQSSSGVVLSQRKYALDILEETSMLDCKPVDTPMDPNVKLVPGQGELLGNPGRYRRLVGKLNYLTITRPDISFPMSVVSQFLQSPCDSHWDAVIRILRYIKSTPGQGVLYENRGHTQVVGYTDADWADSPTDRRSTSEYCVFIGGNLISWKSKKQDVVARSSAEAEYRAMTLATCELIWLRHLLQELRFEKDE
ncbi:Retrovirus-related Pol polyprotein from transposon RE1 [Vitis vinifera]|uniref:Retrovirus-related Pol polyprotein from transposon RE1 n=1 Tax=Vitis vinifera TaxID=29760 RepID=A0A438K6G0_VITVI|nr:Retrovirus-related Pol polyprotein from transposon RE1 [Vitis vinifera]